MKYTLHNLLGFAPQIVWGGGSTGGGGGSDDKPARRPSGGKGTKPTVKSTASSLATDIKMGLSTFGQSKEQQAQTFREQGYSEKAIQSYQERSAASLAKAQAEMDRISKSDSKPAPVPPRSPGPTPKPPVIDEPETVLPTEVDEPLTTVEDISTQTFTDTADFAGDVTAGASVGTAAGGVEQYEAAKPTSVGQAEDEALELMKKGRRATILTKAGGLLGTGEEEGKTRRRRSLIG